MKTAKVLLLLLSLAVLAVPVGHASERIPLKVERPAPGAPQLLGIPFPKGALHSPDHVRVLSAEGEEIPTQVTEVTTWKPADPSIKWIWVFFFAESSDHYWLEYGEDVHRAPLTGNRLLVTNNMREEGYVEVDTGPLRFRINQGAGGFLDKVELDVEGDGFEADDVIAVGPGEGRGSFLDLLDSAGIDSSKAIVRRTWVEKGSGPLHTIIRVEGVYRYGREDNNPSPFVVRIHAYAGKSYLRVLHTLVYTGDPDMHPPVKGQHALIATDPDASIIDEQALIGDPGWTEPNDRIAAVGLSLSYRLSGDLQYRTEYREGAWWEPGESKTFETTIEAGDQLSVMQFGPAPLGMPPVPNASPDERIDGFRAAVMADGARQVQATKAEGWVDVSDGHWGIGIGIRHFLETYPKEISLRAADTLATAYLWSPQAEPMSFARASSEEPGAGGMMDNFAQGLAKTSELVYYFHGAEKSGAVERVMNYVLRPPVAHTDPAWYAESNVYGPFAPRSEEFAAFERGLDYKFDWMLFNQNWEPWYGMFDYGDWKTYYYGDDWYVWNNNEPIVDFMWWLEFMRTGNRAYYLAAEAASRHTMDVDNIHWPAPPEYIGDDNAALTWWQTKEARAAHPGTPYLGVGRRHDMQHWTALLSAHVWVTGWLASYYLAGYHRGLDVAKLTADMHLRRIWGKHGLTGRRLYLSIWNLVEVWDATKNERYLAELKDRVDRMLDLQRQQGGSLVIARYGYAQVYASHGLSKYLQMTGDPDVRAALIRHARSVRDVPPLNHEMESYLSSIHSLLVGYRLSGDPSFYREALRRGQVLKTDELSQPEPFRSSRDQGDLAEALERVSHLPDGEGPRPPVWKITNGLRVFGWTHIYNVPWLVHWLEQEGPLSQGGAPARR